MKIIGASFSPTGTTETTVRGVVEAIHNELEDSQIEWLDFTLPKSREIPLSFSHGDIVVLGMPVYAGRIPNLLLPYMKQLRGEGTIGIPIAVYGNRHYDNALIELADIMRTGGMQVIAGGAFIGEHSFSYQLGQGRPDEKDLLQAKHFAQAISEKLLAEDYTQVVLPGDENYQAYYQPKDPSGETIDIRPAKPVTDVELCIDCKVCAQSCPLGSIDYHDVTRTPGICMKCCACIKRCPTGAKCFSDAGYLYHKKNLEELYMNRREPEYYL